ncbi:MAG: PAS domain-containing protein [Rhodospirillaceae bacterium]|nr:PAS domain-containing protein [Rhodospirillaceae bacterium]
MRLAVAVFEHSPEGLLVADARGRITKKNSAYRKIVGLPDGQIMGKPLNDMLFMGATASTSVLDPLKDGNQAQREQWAKNPAGHRFATGITVSVVRNDEGLIQ